MVTDEADYIENLTDTLSFHMRHLPGGIFSMGSNEKSKIYRENPIHKVELDAFYIGIYPVTQVIWQEIMGNNPSRFKGNNRPVEEVSWNHIVGEKEKKGFLQYLNEKTVSNRPSGWVYRLPTEAEWEYAARFGEPEEKYIYASSDKLKEVGWYDGNSHGETKDVGLKRPNGAELYDMSGNVWEWCMDFYDKDFYAKCDRKGVESNPCNLEKDSVRVVCGGAWFDHPPYCRVAFRNGWPPASRNNHAGFRLVLSPLAHRKAG